jgi:copper chaperone CopZ
MACKRECNDVFKNVQNFQTNVMKINQEFEKISTTTLTNIEKRLYYLTQFIRQQEETLKVREEEFVQSFEKISRKIMNTYELFINRGPRIQLEWLRFIHRLDDSLERSLKQSVKNTLIDLGKHIIGDK